MRPPWVLAVLVLAGCAMEQMRPARLTQPPLTPVVILSGPVAGMLPSVATQDRAIATVKVDGLGRPQVEYTRSLAASAAALTTALTRGLGRSLDGADTDARIAADVGLQGDDVDRGRSLLLKLAGGTPFDQIPFFGPRERINIRLTSEPTNATIRTALSNESFQTEYIGNVSGREARVLVVSAPGYRPCRVAEQITAVDRRG